MKVALDGNLFQHVAVRLQPNQIAGLGDVDDPRIGLNAELDHEVGLAIAQVLEARVKVYSPTPANRQRYAEEMAAELGIDVVPVDSARDAVRGVDILSPCTDSMVPVFEADWLEPGMHVVPVHTQETSLEAAARCDIRIRQGIDSMPLAPEHESPRMRSTSGLSWTAFVGGSEEEMKRLPDKSPYRLPVERYAHFADLAKGTVPGRTSRDQITFYYNNGNQGIQFAAVGGLIYRNVLAKGGGRELPTEWFLEHIRA